MAYASVREDHEIEPLDINQRIKCSWGIENYSLVIHSMISHVVVHHIKRT